MGIEREEKGEEGGEKVIERKEKRIERKGNWVKEANEDRKRYKGIKQG